LNAVSHKNLLVIGRDFCGVVPIVVDVPIVIVGSMYHAALTIASFKNSPSLTAVFLAMAVHSGLDRGRIPGVF